MFKQGDWVVYKDYTDPYVVAWIGGTVASIYPVNARGYVYGWHDPRAVFSGGRVNQPYEMEVSLSDCVLIPKEVVDIMRGAE